MQTKLSVNVPDDDAEREADRVAEGVLRPPGPAGGAVPVARSPAAGPGVVPPATTDRIAGLRGSGQPMLPSMRQYFEERFGRDFRSVRLHDGPEADALALELRARAFTRGNDIAFAPGQLAPGTHEGRRLLAHELAHTVQQAASPAAPTIQREPGPLGDFELELDPSLAPPPWAPGRTLSLPQPTFRLPPRRPAQLTPGLSLDPVILRQIREWIEQQIRHWNGRIEQRTRQYEARNWRLRPEDLADFRNRIQQLETLRTDLEAALPPSVNPQIARTDPVFGAWLTRRMADALTLANVVANEAGVSNDAAKRAVAYAYLNRTGGTVREPTGAEISGYEDLPTRWAGMNDTERLSFLQNFIPSLRAARSRLSDLEPAASDPTGGATHWVSPIGLRAYDAARHGATRYSRTVGSAANRAFPLWARDPGSPEVAAMQAAGQLDSTYDEIEVPGVPREQFLFYRGVR